MNFHRIQPGLYQVSLPGVNAFLLDSDSDGLTLVDTGVPGSTQQISKVVQALGRSLGDIKHILVTHCHPDHAGSLAELKALTSARVYMHKKDADMVAKGLAMRRLIPTPGILNRILYRRMIAPKPKTVEPATTDEFISDGDELPVAGGITVIHTPGHSEGHVVFLSKRCGSLFVGDAAANFLGLRPMIAYEHLQQGIVSLGRVCRYDFEVACFGHGSPILAGAAKRFRKRWGGRRS